MAYQYILYEVRDRLAFVTINRSEKLNALNRVVIDELFDVFYRIKSPVPEAVQGEPCIPKAVQGGIGAVIITGSGDRAFVAGADIKELAELNQVAGKAKMLRGQSLFSLIESLGIPVIAAVNGFALGGGCELALACTVRFASEEAKFGQPEVSLGIMPGYGGTQRLSRLIGKGRALELILSGEMIDAAEAYRIGLVNKVCPKDKLLAEAEHFARQVMSRGPLAIKSVLEAINRGMEMPLSEGLNLEANLFGRLCETKDMQEGLKAFLEKRQPNFQGK